MRDILSHHYFDVDAEIVFSVCANHIDKLARTAERMADDLRKPGRALATPVRVPD